MVKTNQIKKLVNGEIADADDVNQIVENAGSEGGTIPYNDDDQQRSTTGAESVGSQLYPWGSLFVNQDAFFNEMDTVSGTIAASVTFSSLRKFVAQKDTPNSYSGQGSKFVAVKASADGLEFVTSPNKSTVVLLVPCATSGTGTDKGEVRTTSLNPGVGASTGNYRFFATANTSLETVHVTKFQKIAGVTTVTVYVQLWKRSAGGAAVNCTVDIGGQSGNVDSGNVTSPTWYSFTINVSSLSDGTVYDVTVQIKRDSDVGFMGTLIGFGS